MMRLLDILFPPRGDERILRDASLDSFLALLAPSIVPETRPETVALFPFHHAIIRAAVHEAKYHGSDRAFAFFAAALADYLRDADDIKKPILIPVPLSETRFKERGFNQIEEIIERTATELEIPIDTTLLRRIRDTASQVTLPREAREENMRGAFRAARSLDPAYTYILVDDVITTGATLQAAIDALKAARAEHIIPLALAH